MKAIKWRDEKLYRITARDYGDPFSRVLGIILYSLLKGTGIALGIVVVLDPRLLYSVRFWYSLVLPLAGACGIWTAFSDKRLFVCEIAIYSDRIIRHSGEKTIGISRSRVLSMQEGGRWTLFGRANGLTVRSYNASIFIPADCDQYAEIKSKLGGWP